MTLPASSRANHLSRTYPKQQKPKASTEPVIHMFQAPDGEWQVTINGGQPFIATIIDVALWKRVTDLEAELKAIKMRLRGN
jgi:hypothetical protein